MTEQPITPTQQTQTSSSGFLDTPRTVRWSIPDTLSFADVVSHSADTLFNNYGFFFKLVAVVVGVTMPLFMVLGALSERIGLLQPIIQIGLVIWQVFIQLGATRMLFRLANNQSVTFRELFSYDKQLLKNYIWANLRTTLKVMIGFMLLFIPGVIWALKYQFTLFAVADKGYSAKDAMEYSARLTDGKKIKLFFYAVGFGMINLAGAILFMIGLIVTMPITIIASFTMYKVIEKELGAQSPTQVVAAPVAAPSQPM